MPGAAICELAVPCEVFAIPRPEYVDPWWDVTLCASAPCTVIAGVFATTKPFGVDELAAADTAIVPLLHMSMKTSRRSLSRRWPKHTHVGRGSFRSAQVLWS